MMVYSVGLPSQIESTYPTKGLLANIGRNSAFLSSALEKIARGRTAGYPTPPHRPRRAIFRTGLFVNTRFRSKTGVIT